MPPAYPPEFRRRAVDLFREREKPVAQLAAELGISESCLRRWASQDDVDARLAVLRGRPRRVLATRRGLVDR
ncbi:transposase [Actinomycetospora rhizophila]|uniref:Transposase n=1 Tax=Actinomycetospora rhizophila TaxID=1416876 RepID=A0ABV9ZKQ3_9PSEU